MVYFKENYIFKVPEGVQHFTGEGVQIFPGGGGRGRGKSSMCGTLASMTSRRQIQDGGPHTSDPRWRPPRRQIQDGGPHDTKMAAPTKSRWRPL